MQLMALTYWRLRKSRNKIVVAALVLMALVVLAYLMWGHRVGCAWNMRGNLIQNEYEFVPERASYAAWKKCSPR